MGRTVVAVLADSAGFLNSRLTLHWSGLFSPVAAGTRFRQLITPIRGAGREQWW